MGERFFCGPIKTSPGEVVYLDGPEMHHLVHVMRARPGDRVTLFDGEGHEYYAEYLSSSKQRAELRILATSAVNRELPATLVVACALPKGERQRWLVEKLTELGVSWFVPLVTERSIVRPTAESLDRLRRTVIEACKQCGRNRLMEISPPQRWHRFFERSDLPPCKLLGHPAFKESAGDQGSGYFRTAPKEGVDETVKLGAPMLEQVRWAEGAVVAIGPEGGFTASEVALALARGWHVVSLGATILRTETAAVMLASLLAGKFLGLV